MQKPFALLQSQTNVPKMVSIRNSSSPAVVGASSTSHCFPEDPEVSASCNRLEPARLLLPLLSLSRTALDLGLLRNLRDFCHCEVIQPSSLVVETKYLTMRQY